MSKKTIDCPTCWGGGTVSAGKTEDEDETCPTCGGSGEIEVNEG
jgi:DnaJ-class molecular chaperone